MGFNISKAVKAAIEANEAMIRKAVEEKAPTMTPVEDPTIRGSVLPGDPYYQSPEYRAYQERMGSGPQMGTADIYDSPYFGRFGSGSFGRAADAAYKEYLARISAPPPPPQASYPTPVYPEPVPMPTPGPRPMPAPPQQEQYATPTYGSRPAGNVGFIRDSYGVRPAMSDPSVYFGGYDRSLFDRIREEALARARPVQYAKGGPVVADFFKFLNSKRML